MSENGKTHMVWKVSFRVDKFIMTSVKPEPNDTPQDMENKHLVAQVVEVVDAHTEIVEHLQAMGIAASDVRIVAVTTQDSIG